MKISAADVMKLRKMTSAGMMDCKKALTEAEGDFQKAVEIIREKGKMVAAKRADRETSEGAVQIRIDGNKGMIVCLGCETDFVAATPDFQKLITDIADAAIKAFPATKEELMAVALPDGHTIEEEVSAQTGRTGEKHVIACYETIEAPYVAQYVHHNSKVGAIVGFSAEVSEEVGRHVAQQATAMNPISVSKEDCPQDIVEKELAMYKQQMAEDPKMAGKPEQLLENIAKGKMGKFFKENTLTEQDFVMDTKMSVKEYIAKNSKDAKVLSFKRFSLSD